MKTIRLTKRELLRGYDTVAKLYGTVPPLSMWRAWEAAAYRKFRLSEPVLDVGCGDGDFFRLLWPRVKDVVGVDADPHVTKLARESGTYRDVITVKAHEMNLASGAFSSCFANCSLEHMDELDRVLACVAHAVQPRGEFLLSVVTNHFIEWNSITGLLREAGHFEAALNMETQFLEYHRLANPLSIEAWTDKLVHAGFVVEALVPIVPEFSSRVFLTLDSAWHIVRKGGAELGSAMHARFLTIPQFDKHARTIVEGLFGMDTEWKDTSGAVIFARRK